MSSRKVVMFQIPCEGYGTFYPSWPAIVFEKG